MAFDARPGAAASGRDGAARAAPAPAEAGYRVTEMVGGYEHRIREGLGVEGDAGAVTRPVDQLRGC